MQKIYTCLVDDWELRGTGVGDVISLQVKPMMKLLDLYESYGIKCTFNVEVMQTIYMRKFQSEFPELKNQADAWDKAVIDALKRGHDIQLHIHPQWHIAKKIVGGGWILDENWDITKYDKSEVDKMFFTCISYLKELFEKNEVKHRLCSYRAGSWAFAPSDFMLDILKKYDIKLDMSMVKGLKYNTKHVQLDYTCLEEPYRAFYPKKEDARYISSKKEDVVCIPTFTYFATNFFIHLFDRFSSQVKNYLKSKKNQNVSVADLKYTTKAVEKNVSYNEWGENQSFIKRYIQMIIDFKKPRVSDIARFSKTHMTDLYKNILMVAKNNNEKNIPVILENHTKDIESLDNIEFFIKKMKNNKSVEFITITKLVELIENGTIEVIKK